MLKEKELTKVPGLKPEDVVVIKRFNYGEKNKVLGRTLSINMKQKVGKQPITDVDSTMDFYELRILTLLYGIKSASFLKLDANNKESAEVQRRQCIENLEQETGEFLYNEIDKINSEGVLTPEVEKKLEESSKEEVKETPTLTTS